MGWSLDDLGGPGPSFDGVDTAGPRSFDEEAGAVVSPIQLYTFHPSVGILGPTAANAIPVVRAPDDV